MSSYLAYGAPNVVRLSGLKYTNSAGTVVYVDSETIMVQAYLASDYTTAVGSPISLTYVAASNGNYYGEFASTVPFAVGTLYALKWLDANNDNANAWLVVPCLRAT